MKMKPIIIIGCVLALSSCATAPKTKTTDDGRAVKSGMPLFVRNAVKNIPPDSLAGVGSAKIGAAGLGQARTVATARARAEISRQLNSVVKDMLTDYTASSEVSPKDAVSYQESITVTLSKSTLTGATIIEQDQDGDNNYWVVVTLAKTSIANEINQAQAAARLALPKAHTLDASDRLDKALEKIAAEPVGFAAE